MPWIWLLIAAPPAGLAILVAACLRVRRYSPSHVVAQLTIRGRGLYFSHTPDGNWWRLRLRPRRCAPSASTVGPDDPPATGTREPRRPRGPRPLTSVARP